MIIFNDRKDFNSISETMSVKKISFEKFISDLLTSKLSKAN